MADIRAILFDAGNTLVHLDCAFIAEVAADYGIAIDPAELRRIDLQVRYELDRDFLQQVASGQEIGQGVVSMQSRELVQRYFTALLSAAGVPSELHREILGRLLIHDRAGLRGLWHRLEPDAVPTLELLRERGFVLGVISNSDGRLAAKLDAIAIGGYFDLVVDSAVVEVEKPDRRIFDLTLAQLGLAPADGLYIGDSYSVDVLGARRAGLQAALYDPARLYRNIDTEAIETLGDIPALLA